VSKENIKAVMLGTTAFVNAVLQCSDELAKVSIIRLCGPSTLILPPFVDWPKKLKDQIMNKVFMADGGLEYDGTEIQPINEA
jgi:N-methylhydantoinase A/oxoprolinase/acetone carboxylase beta subunit